MKVPTNLLRDGIAYYVKKLIPLYGEDESRQMLWILTGHFFGMNRLKLSLDADFRLTESEMLTLHFAVKDLLNHKPVQYITGKTVFYDLELEVNESVLIPRPETEQMIELFRSKNQMTLQNLLDAGTGSGCIALALAKIYPDANLFACDISAKALEVANRNAEKNNVKVHLLTLNLLHPDQFAQLPQFDAIVSNPPYVTESEKGSMPANVVEAEPHLALFVPDADPLIFYRKLGELAQSRLTTQGQLMVEINEKFGEETVELFESQGFAVVELLKDYHNKDRFVWAQK